MDWRFNLGLRHESYHGELCREGCFSRWELARSDDMTPADYPPPLFDVSDDER